MPSNLSVVDLTTFQHLCLLIYGANGIGKTYLAGTMPGKSLFINYDGNPETLLKFPKDNWDVVEGPKTWSQIQSMWTDPLLDNYDNLVLDNLTGLSRILVLDVIKTLPTQGRDVRPAPDLPILRDYGLASERLRAACSAHKDRKTKQNIIAIVHEKVEKDENTGALYGGPSVPGQVPAHVLSLYGEVIYMARDHQQNRAAYLSQRTYFPAATRKLANAEKPIPNPNLAVMYKEFLK